MKLSIHVALPLLIASLAAANDQVVSSSLNSATPANLVQDEYSTDDDKTNLRQLQNGPNAGKRMSKWRKVHNDMRKKYHIEYGGEFTPIKWNMELKREAEMWANELVKTCANRLPGASQNPNYYGVNSAMESGSRAFRSPVAVMKMWERKLPLGYPDNSVATQVLWSKTQYVGCADASSPVDGTKKCTASVCYYAKAGNCAFGRFGGTGNWTQAVLNGPACSTACPPNVEDC